MTYLYSLKEKPTALTTGPSGFIFIFPFYFKPIDLFILCECVCVCLNNKEQQMFKMQHYGVINLLFAFKTCGDK